MERLLDMEWFFDFVSDVLHRVFGSTKLRAYESACLEAWKRELSPAAVAILDRQLEFYDLVQRQSADKLVCFFRIGDPACKKLPEDSLFALRAEASVARVALRATGSKGRSSLRADISLFRGRFFGLEFNKRPQTVFPKDVKSDEIEVTDVAVLLDPMSVESYETEPLSDTSTLGGWLREWAQERDLRELRRPLPPSTRDKIVEHLDTRLPSDYLQLVEQTEGLEVGHCEIHGLSQIRTIVLPDVGLYILAEVEDRGAVGAQQGDSDGVLYYLDNETHEAEAVGTSLQAVIERELELRRRGEDATG
jgi:hypothetical protein